MCETEPIPYRSPDTKRIPTFENQVRRRFVLPLAKGAEGGIGPTPLLKAVRRPNTVLVEEPGKELALRGCPHLPNDVLNRGGDKAFELNLVRRGSRVGTAVREFPNNGVRRAGI